MAKLSILAGATSVSLAVFIQDSSSTTGAGLTGLAFNTASLTCYSVVPGSSSAAITLATLAAANSAWSSGGFKEIDSTNMPGWYRFDIPNTTISTGRSVGVHFKGASNMAPLPLEIELTAVNNQSTGFGLVNVSADVVRLLGTAWLTPGTAGTPDVNVKLWNALATVALPLVPTTAGRTLDVTAANKVNGVVLVDTVTTYTGNTPQTGDNYARIGAPAGASVSADVAAINTKTTNLPAAPASTTNITAGTITTVTNLTNAPTAGDLTATMKTSVTTAATAATPALSAAGVAAIWAYVVEGTATAVQYLRGIASASFGVLSGAATTTVVIQDVPNTKPRITATVDSSGNRSAITTDLT